MDAAKRAEPDGYTLLQLDSDHLAAVPHLHKQRGADAVKQFEPVASLFRTTFLVAVMKRLPQLPAVPTSAEAGGPAAFDVNAFVVRVAPKGLPAVLRNKISADVAKVLTDPELRSRISPE